MFGVAPLRRQLARLSGRDGAGYVLHSRVSFRGHGSRDNAAAAHRPLLHRRLISLGLNSLFVWLLTGPLDGPTWWPVIPMLFVTPLVTFALNAVGVR